MLWRVEQPVPGCGRTGVRATRPRYYLWPDQLRLWSWAGGLGFATAAWVAGALPLWAPVAFLWFVVVVPLSLFGFARQPVLRCLTEGEHSEGHSPFESLVGRADRADRAGRAGRADRAVPSLARRVMAHLWACAPVTPGAPDTRLSDPDASAHAALLAAGVSDFFSSGQGSGALCERGQLRWFLYWASPVWAGYLLLLGAYVLHALQPEWVLPVPPAPAAASKTPFNVAVIIWTAVSSLFLMRQACIFEHFADGWSSSSPERRSQLLRLPANSWGCMRDLSVQRLGRITLQAVNLIPGLLLAALPVL